MNNQNQEKNDLDILKSQSIQNMTLNALKQVHIIEGELIKILHGETEIENISVISNDLANKLLGLYLKVTTDNN